jgi:hypothetical protein
MSTSQQKTAAHDDVFYGVELDLDLLCLTPLRQATGKLYHLWL